MYQGTLEKHYSSLRGSKPMGLPPKPPTGRSVRLSGLF